MDHLGGLVTGPRPGRMRDRRGRGPRGPMTLPGPLSPRGVPVHRSARESFDALVGDVLAALEPRFADESDHVDVVVEEAPLLPPEWTDEVPTSVVIPGVGSTRVVLYRLPMLHRSRGDDELEANVWSIVLDRLAEVWHVSPDELDPRGG